MDDRFLITTGILAVVGFFVFAWIWALRRASRNARILAKVLKAQAKNRLFAWVVKGRFKEREVIFWQFAIPAHGGNDLELKMAYHGPRRENKLFRLALYPKPTQGSLLKGKYVYVPTRQLNSTKSTEQDFLTALEELSRGCEIVESNGTFFQK